MIYLDGSALCRFLPGVRHGEVWQTWVVTHQGDLVTSQLSLTELRQAAALYPRDAIDEITAIIEKVRSGIPIIRFSDDNVSISSHANAVLKPFAALHVGAAAGDDRVDTIATYDPALAHVAEIYRLKVVTPGLDERWFLEFEGPVDTWSPIDLDAPKTPGSEYALNPKPQTPNPHEVALEEESSDSEPLALGEAEQSDQGELEHEKFLRMMKEAEEQALNRIGSQGDLTEDQFDESAEEETLADVTTVDGDASEAIEASEPEGVPASEAASPPLSPSPATPHSPTPTLQSTPTSPAPPTPSLPPPPPPTASDEEEDASRRRAEKIARLGVYTPKVEAWEEASSLGGRSQTESSPTPQAASASAPAPAPAPEPVFAPSLSATPISQSAPVPDDSGQPATPVGEPVRRPFLERQPERREEAVPQSEEEDDGIPAPVMPPVVVQFEELISYAPARIDVSGSHPLPGAHPFARAGQTAAMEAPPISSKDVPALEPLLTPPPLPVTRPIQRDFPDLEAGTQDKDDRSSRRRRGKDEKRRKGQPPPSPAPASEEDAGWRLEDIIGRDVGKGKRKPT